MSGSGRGIPRRALDDEIISPQKLIADLLAQKYFHQAWPSQAPHCVESTLLYGDPTGATGDINFAYFHGFLGGQAAYQIKGAGQTLLAPTQNATSGYLTAGLDIGAAEGVEYIWGGLQTAQNPLGGTVGSQRGNKFIRHKFRLVDASEAAECAVGFRTAEAGQALIDNYNDMVVINVQAGVVNVETIVGGAATVTTAIPGLSAVADNDVITCEVRLKGGKPRFIFTNHTQGEVAVFQVPDAESLADTVVYVPFSHFLQGAAGCQWDWAAITVGDVEADDESLQY